MPHQITNALKYTPTKAVQRGSARSIRSSKLVVTIAQIKRGYTKKTLENRYYGVNIATREISRNDHKLPKIQRTRENNKTKELLKFRFRQGKTIAKRSTTARSETGENSNTIDAS